LPESLKRTLKCGLMFESKRNQTYPARGASHA
jgi:hypothetical protein